MRRRARSPAAGRRSSWPATRAGCDRRATAKMSPRTTLAPVPTISQMTLLRRIWVNSGSTITAKLASANWPLSSWKLRRIVPAAGYTRKIDNSARAGPTKTHGRIRSRHFGLERADQSAHAEEQQPDATDTHEQGDHREQELGDHLIALTVAQVGRAGRVPDGVVDRGQEVRPALRVVQHEDARPAQTQADQAQDRQDEPRQPRTLSLSLSDRPDSVLLVEIVTGRCPPLGDVPRIRPAVR